MNIVVAGGGFAGVRAALELAKAHVGRITLVSDSQYLRHHEALHLARTGHQSKPFQVSLDELCADYPNIRVVQDFVVSIDVDRMQLIGSAASYDYDELIMALGVVPARNAEGTTEAVARIYAELEAKLEAGRRFDRVVTVVGGGKEGVELAGAIYEYTQSLIGCHPVSYSKVRVSLVERSKTILPSHAPQAQRKVTRRLRRKGVDVLLRTNVEVSGEHAMVGRTKVPLTSTVWATGSVSNPFYTAHPHLFHIDEHGLVDVDPYLEAYPHVYVIGQNLAVRGATTVKGTLDMADFVVEHLLRASTGEHPLPYRPTSVITTIATDSSWAYVECFNIYAAGRIGRWLASWVERANIRKIMTPMLAKVFVLRSTTKK